MKTTTLPNRITQLTAVIAGKTKQPVRSSNIFFGIYFEVLIFLIATKYADSKKRSSSPPMLFLFFYIQEIILDSHQKNVLCQTHLSISHNSFFTQPRIDLLSQMRGHNKLSAVVPDTADNGNYSQTERAAAGKEPTCYKIHIQRLFKGGRSALR